MDRLDLCPQRDGTGPWGGSGRRTGRRRGPCL